MSGEAGRPILKNAGHCPTCDREVEFQALQEWLRDHYVCLNCGSIPRERALMQVIASRFPGWRELVIHDSSPIGRGASAHLARHCQGYTPSQLFPDRPTGTVVDGVRCENLEALTFGSETIDLHVTQDVLEHVFSPSAVFKELGRTLKPGGAHVFTVPLVRKEKPSRLRARRGPRGEVVHLEEAQYHGNPVDPNGSLVTVDWGYDICRHIFEASGLFTETIHIDDLGMGIRAEYIEVLVTRKPATASRGDFSLP